MHESLIGMSSGWSSIDYTWRDSALYALAVGADENDLMFTYEREMRSVPSFFSLPFYNAVNATPQIPLPYPVHYAAQDYLSARLGRPVERGAHMAFQSEIYKTANPIKGTLNYKTDVTKVYDRGQRGIVLEVDNPIHDESGQLMCRNTSWNIIRDVGGYGGTPFPKAKLTYPERSPDWVANSHIARTANVLYRLTGDNNYSHIDPEFAAVRGKDRPFMQGLSSFGLACLLLCKTIIPGEPERMSKMYVQMRNFVYPDTPIQIQAWKISEGEAIFKLIDNSNNTAVLDNCTFAWD